MCIADRMETPTRRVLQHDGGRHSIKEFTRPGRSARWKWITFQCSSFACACMLAVVVLPTFLQYLRPLREAETSVHMFGYNAPSNQTVLQLLPVEGQADNTQLMAEVRSRVATRDACSVACSVS